MAHLSFARWRNVLLALIFLLAACMVLACLFGSASLDWAQVWRLDTQDHAIFFLGRLPRVLLAALVGISLSSSGAAFQGLLRNPLAEPYILGVSSGAALSGILALALGIGFPWQQVITFSGALGAMSLVYGLTTYKRRPNPQTLLLTGVIFNAFAHAFILLINALAPVDQAHRIMTMLIGSLDAVSYWDLGLAAVTIGTGLVLLLRESRALNILSEGPESAASLGLAPERHLRRIFFAASLMIGTAVSLSGLIGFVGLFVPHIARRLWGPDHRLLIPSSALLGASLLLLCDLLGRVLSQPSGFTSQIPVGAITALLGAPFFMYLLRRLK